MESLDYIQEDIRRLEAARSEIDQQLTILKGTVRQLREVGRRPSHSQRLVRRSPEAKSDATKGELPQGQICTAEELYATLRVLKDSAGAQVGALRKVIEQRVGLGSSVMSAVIAHLVKGHAIIQTDAPLQRNTHWAITDRGLELLELEVEELAELFDVPVSRTALIR